MRIITFRQVLILHELEIKNHGGSSGIRDNGRFFHIGGEDEFHQYFDGTIDEVRIYSRALMDPEILTLYNNH